jgi:pyrrolidone-carboxylate peptidase
VLANGPTCIHSSTDTATLVAALAAQQLPVVESCDAGAYLCEETLYMLEHLRKSTHSLQQVLFVHLPPWQSEIHYRGQNCRCELTLLSDFLQRLLRHFPNRELSR